VLVAPVSAQDTKIGVTAVVNPDATGQPPAQPRRTLQGGLDIFSRESVVTTATGQAQMLFLDESALTVGPNSEVVLDEFVYDPAQKSGKIALSATKGVFRLVGGQISKTNPVTLKTPTATIGVRGGIAIVNQQQGGQMSATFLFGRSMDVTSGGETQTVNRPGFQIRVPGPNIPPLPPQPAPPAELRQSVQALEGSGQQQDQQQQQQGQGAELRADGLAEAGSGNEPAAFDPPPGSGPDPDPGPTLSASDVDSEADIDNTTQQTQTEAAVGAGTSGLVGRYKRSFSTTTGSDDGSSSSDLSITSGTVTAGRFSGTGSSFIFPLPSSPGSLSFTGTSSTTDSPFGPLSGTSVLFAGNEFVLAEATENDFPGHRVLIFAGVPTSSFPTTGMTGYTARRDFLLDSNIPFILKNSGGSLTAPTNDADDFDAAIVWNTSGSSTAQRAFGFAKLAVNGLQSAQTSTAALAVGQVLTAAGKTFILGEMRGTSRVAASQTAHVFEGPVSTVFSGSSDTSFFGANAGYFVLESSVVNTSTGVKPRVAANDKIGDQFLTGVVDFSPNTVFSVNTAATFDPRTSRTLNGYTGGLLESVSSGSVTDRRIFQTLSSAPTNLVIKTSATTNKAQFDIAAESALGVAGTAILDLFLGDEDAAFGDSSTSSGRSAFIDNGAFGAVELPSHNQIVDGSTLAGTQAKLGIATGDVGQLFTAAGISSCDCNFLQWGFWGGRIELSAGVDRRTHLAAWVAGELPTQVQVPTTGTATYTGHMMGTVNTPSATYLAVGTFQNAWNFGTRAGTITITSFDGQNYTGSASAPMATPRDFSGSFSNASNTGMLHGSFAKSSTDNVGGQMGDFHIKDISTSGTNYKAAGVFAAQR
jgi:hypothetical protein